MGIRNLVQRLFLVVGLAVVPTSANARYCEQIEITLSPQEELASCLSGVLSESDARLNTAYGELRGAISKNGKEKAILLRDSQRAWIEYRDANCAWLAPYSVFSPEVIRNVCFIEMTNLRTDDFVGWLATGSVGTDHAPRCGPSESQRKEDAAACEIEEMKYKIADGDLNEIYTKYMAHYQDNSAKQVIQAMRAAQRAWIKYRDLNCELWAAIEGYEGKSPGCLTKMTTDRVGEYKEVGMYAEYGVWTYFTGHAWFHPYEYICDDGQWSMNQCAARSLEIASSQLDALYRELSTVVDESANAKLQEEREAWSTLLERECWAAASGAEEGSKAWHLTYSTCKTRMQRKRISYLESRLVGARQ